MDAVARCLGERSTYGLSVERRDGPGVHVGTLLGSGTHIYCAATADHSGKCVYLEMHGCWLIRILTTLYIMVGLICFILLRIFCHPWFLKIQNLPFAITCLYGASSSSVECYNLEAYSSWDIGLLWISSSGRPIWLFPVLNSCFKVHKRMNSTTLAKRNMFSLLLTFYSSLCNTNVYICQSYMKRKWRFACSKAFHWLGFIMWFDPSPSKLHDRSILAWRN